ncbi:MAG TPA: cyclic pyranopterin monophosphate synthase MoaC [Cyclobacteriaceae bacterium]|jgi:cyclic pyranopterin phosphate synthase|nr:MAG: cyclic pyranopterin monophosphate synthase MoaC [Bacteroidota bacterium]
MKQEKLTHVDSSGNPQMVDVSQKTPTRRVARARATVHVGQEILEKIRDNELMTKKGPVFQTAIIAGITGAKKTSELIPMCHPLGLEDCRVSIKVEDDVIVIDTTAVVTARTGVEMEALTAAATAALTIYDMCKAMSHDIVISEIKLMEKTGGKSDFKREEK